MDKKPSRQRVHHLRVPVLPAENITIKQNATNCSMSVSAYLRNLGLNYKPKGIFDGQAVMEMVKVNGDLGRLGGLLKMWLTNNDGWQALTKEQELQNIHKILKDIQAIQDLLLDNVVTRH